MTTAEFKLSNKAAKLVLSIKAIEKAGALPENELKFLQLMAVLVGHSEKTNKFDVAEKLIFMTNLALKKAAEKTKELASA